MTMFQKKDLALMAVIVATAGVSALMIRAMHRDAGVMVRIAVDGELYGEYRLSENQSVSVDAGSGYNRIVIENGSVYMAEADCPDKYCMDYKPASRNGETIICLPHRLVVEVTGEQDAQQPDVIVP